MGCCCQGQEEDAYVDRADGDEVERSSTKIPKPDHRFKPQDLRNSHVEFIKEGEKHKNQGNIHFKAKRYKKAIESYILAMTSEPPQIVYYTNLALAYKADNQLQSAINIINEMKSNDAFSGEMQGQTYLKGELIKSRCLMLIVKNYCLGNDFDIKNNHAMLQHIDEALATLEKTKDRESMNGNDFLNTGTKLKQFLTNSIIAKSEPQNLLIYMTTKLKQPTDAFYNSQAKISQHYSSNEQILRQITDIVSILKKEAVKEEEDFVQDPITYQSLQNPVIVPSGVTYNIKTLKQHFKNNGYNDPITHQLYKVGDQVLFPNHSIRQYVNQQRKHITQDDLYALKY